VVAACLQPFPGSQPEVTRWHTSSRGRWARPCPWSFCSCSCSAS